MLYPYANEHISIHTHYEYLIKLKGFVIAAAENIKISIKINVLFYLQYKFLVDDLLADGRLKVSRFEEAQEELVD